jgi:hypothetical protein
MLQGSYGALLCSLRDQSQARRSKQCALRRHIDPIDCARRGAMLTQADWLRGCSLLTRKAPKQSANPPAKCTGAAPLA